MKRINRKGIAYKTTFASVALAALLFTGCSKKANNQTAGTGQQSNAGNTSVGKAEPEPITTITQFTYIQPLEVVRDDSKLVINARTTSFKQLDKDNDKIVEKDEFYDGLYNLLDADRNNAIDETELRREVDFISKNTFRELDGLSDWDGNMDKQISKDEFKNKLASILDVPDGKKLAQNLYIVWDTDNDDRIEKLELENVEIRFDRDNN